MRANSMEMAETFPKRVRWLTIATGIASAFALFPILALLYPALLIFGGIIQPRFPVSGRWLIWAGAAELWVIVITYDVMLLQNWREPRYMALAFFASTILLTWCSVELVADGVNRLRALRSAPRTQPQPVSLGAWIVAAVLNLIAGRIGYSFVISQRDPSDPHLRAGFYPFATLLVTVLIVIAFDISLARQFIKTKHARARDGARMNGRQIK